MVFLRKLIIFAIFYSCNSVDNSISRVQHIDSLTANKSSVVNKIFTDTLISKDNIVYTRYHYDNLIKLTLIYIEETATDNKYISYIYNDSLIKVTVEYRDPNYSSDEAASYYVDNDSVFHKIETRGSLEDIKRFILDRKRNIKYFKDTLAKKLKAS